MSIFTPRNIKFLITINIFVILILPQLNNVHYDPLPQFWAETTEAWAVISLFLIVTFCSKSISIPKVTIPLLLLAAYIMIQPQLVHISFHGLSYATAMEFFLCTILAISICSIVSTYSLPETVTIFAQALVTGAMLQSAIGFLQYTGHYNILGDFIFYDASHPTTNIFGHFGQRNHYCHYLSWAVFGLIYLYLTNKILKSNFYTILLWLVFSITIASSRSVFIYFALAIIISGIYFGLNRNTISRKLFITIIISSFALFIFEYGYPIIQNIFHIHNSHQIQSGLERLSSTAADNGTGRRIIEWHKAWLTFKANPVFGFGLNEYSHQSVFLQPLFKHTPMNSGLFTNCHNLIFQFLAETGLIGTTILLLGILWSLYGLIKQSCLESIIIICMVATTITHSMVEYPLWYFYFLCPFIMFLSIDKPLFNLKPGVLIKFTTLPLLIIIYFIISSSIVYDTMVYYIDTPKIKNTFISQARYLEKIVNNNTLLSFPAMFTLDNYINVNQPNTNALFDLTTQLKYENLFTSSHPYPDNLIKLAMLNWNNGNYTLAKKYANLAIIAFPVYKKTFLNTLKDKRYKQLSDDILNYKE
jgi:O-antigen ligase